MENSKKVVGKKVNINPGEMQRLVLSRVTKIIDKMEAKNDLHLHENREDHQQLCRCVKEGERTDHKQSKFPGVLDEQEKIAQAPVIATTKVKDRDSR